MTELQCLVMTRLKEIFDRLRAGQDIPPALRLRTEGLMEALVLAGDMTADDFDNTLEEQHTAYCGASLSDTLGPDWRQFHPFPELPIWMDRAPVFPSTSD